MRSLVLGIMPLQVEPEGLPVALEELASSITEQANIECEFECPIPITVADTTVATHLYRIAQEAVNNATRHSQATLVLISLSHYHSDLILEIVDNGNGFDTESAINYSKPQSDRRYGIGIMNYRAGMIGGRLTVTRLSEGGTSMKCTVPYERISDDDSNQAGENSHRRRSSDGAGGPFAAHFHAK